MKRKKLFKRIGLSLVALVLIVRFGGVALAPSIVNSILEDYGYEVEFEDISVSMFYGEVQLTGVSVHGLDNPTNELLHLQHAIVDIDVGSTLAFDPMIRRAELDGLDVYLRRTLDGDWNIASFLETSEAAEVEEVPEESPEDPAEFSLKLPVKIHAVRAQDIHVFVDDQQSTPRLESELTVNIAANDLGFPGEEGSLEIIADATSMIDFARLEASLQSSEKLIDANLAFELRGLRTEGLVTLLAELGVGCRGDVLDGRGRLNAVADVRGEESRTLASSLTLESWELTANGVEVLALDDFGLTTELSEEFAVPELRAVGCRARTRQELDGQLSLAGFSWVGTSGSAEREASAPADQPEQVTEPLPWRVDLCRIREGKLVHEDVATQTELSLQLDNFELTDLNSRFDGEASLVAEASSPGIFESATMTGSVTTGPRIELDFGMRGCTFEACTPQLRALGVTPRMANGEARGSLSLLANADGGGLVEFEEFWFQEAEERIGIRNVRIDVASLGEATHVREVSLAGAQAKIHRIDDVRIAICGLEVGPTASSPAAAPQVGVDTPEEPVPAPAQPTTPIDVPEIRLDRFVWEDSSVEFEDAKNPDASFALEDVRFELRDFGLGLTSEATVEMELDFRGVCETIAANGTIRSKPGLDLTTQLRLGANGLHGPCVAAWMKNSGLAPVFEYADASAALEASLASFEDGMRASLRLSEVEYGSGETTYASLSQFRVDQLDVTSKGIAIANVLVDGPTLRVERGEDGRWSAFGIGPSGPEDEPSVSGQAVEAASSEVGKSDEQKDAAAPNDPMELTVESFECTGGKLEILDALDELGDVRSISYSSSVGRFELGAQDSTTFESTLSVDGHPARVSVNGSLVPNPEDLIFAAQLQGRDLDGGVLNQYLPPSIQLAFQQAQLNSQLNLQWTTREPNEHSLSLTVSDVKLSEPGSERAYVALDEFRLSAPELDGTSDRYLIEELVVAGARMEALRRDGGSVQVAGLILTPESPEDEVDETSEEADSQVERTEVSWARQFDSRPLPIVEFGKLDLELASLEFVDTTSADAVPLQLSARVTHEKPLQLLSRTPEELEPLEIQLTSSVSPIIREATANLAVALWEEDARVKLDWQVDGIRGQGLTEVLPELAESLDGSGLQDGRATGILEARLIGMRRNPLDFDLRNGFGFEVELDQIAFAEADTVLAGFESFDLSVERVDPVTGATRISNVELTGIQGRAVASPAGIEALGITLLNKPDEGGEPVVEAEPPTTEAPAEPYSGPEVQIDRAVISGLDFILRDEFSDPPRELPINALDFSLERFSTETFVKPRPFRVAAYVGAGSVELPKPRETRGALAGLAGAAMSAIRAEEDEFELEERPLFGEMSLSGTMSLGPQPKGRLTAGIDGLELLGFSGVASQSGVEIGGGVLDSWLRVQMKGEKGLAVRSNLVFTHLSLDEPPDGPISTYLKLPAPLDTVLFTLENKDDEHRIPVNFDMGADGLTTAKVAALATKTMTEVIASALASAPIRVGDGVTEMLGLQMGEASPTSVIGRVLNPVLRLVGLAERPGPQSPPAVIEFEPGQYALDAVDVANLQSILKEVAKRQDFVALIEHSFGAEDLQRAERLANPTKEECQEIATGLRRRKWALLRSRSELASDVTASFAVRGQDGTADLVEELREVEAELGRIEIALDETLALLRPGSDRSRQRRTREAMLEIGASRMASIQLVLDEAMRGDTSARFEIRRPRLDAFSEDGLARVIVKIEMIPEE